VNARSLRTGSLLSPSGRSHFSITLLRAQRMLRETNADWDLRPMPSSAPSTLFVLG
jgi:hypothetical protein